MNRSIVPSAVAIVFILSSCSQLRKKPPTMGADAPLTGGEGIALVNELQDAFIVSTSNSSQICEYTLPQHQEAQTRPYEKYVKEGHPPKQFKCIRYKAATVAQAQAHMETGFALTDLYCDIYFRRISEHSNQRRFARGVVNDVGAAITAVLGLTKVISPVVGGVGAGFGLVDSSFRNYDDAFLVSADLPLLQAKVYSEQAKFRELAEKRTDIKRYSQANSMILRYANFCSYTGMRGLINSSLSQTTEDPPSAMDRMTQYITTAIKSAKQISDAQNGDTADGIDNVSGPAVEATTANQM